ncbi:Band 4.1-like protein 5 [Acipenser ruthenus]|uniref:Band 4.1-like protein 5 n=1 Tax=Acipenser ruthenus TaxID=7906 RepID=A0A662YPG8_ACIRT|nr:Band 4.1-like protein 5 [Acipenser ruthenus]
MLSFWRRTLGRRSIRKHAEKERLREAQRASTHIPAAGEAKSIITCRVSLLDGTDVSVDLPHWLDNTKSIKKQVKIGPPYCLHLRVKFYSSEPNNLHEELTRLECPFDTAVELAAFSLQAELGDCDPAEQGPELVSEFRFIPEQTEDTELSIYEKWKECRAQNHVFNQNNGAKVLNKRPTLPVVAAVPATPIPLEIETLPRSPGASQSEKMSLPLIADLLDSQDLLETCIDEFIRVPVTMTTAGMPEEEGPSMGASGSNENAEENVALSVYEDSATRRKRLEIESIAVSAAPRSNINVNMNSREEVVKLTEKSLNNVTSSSAVAPSRPPEELKSNILKAQAEAALKVTREDTLVTGDKNCNLQEAVSRNMVLFGRTGSSSVSPPLVPVRPERQDSRDLLRTTVTPSDEVQPVPLSEDHLSPATAFSAEPDKDATVGLKSKMEELDSLLSSLTENLIDFTEATPLSGVFTNCLVESDATPPTATSSTERVQLNPESLGLTAGSSVTQRPAGIATSIVNNQEKEDMMKPKRLLTTEL